MPVFCLQIDVLDEAGKVDNNFTSKGCKGNGLSDLGQ